MNRETVRRLIYHAKINSDQVSAFLNRLDLCSKPDDYQKLYDDVNSAQGGSTKSYDTKESASPHTA